MWTLDARIACKRKSPRVSTPLGGNPMTVYCSIKEKLEALGAYLFTNDHSSCTEQLLVSQAIATFSSVWVLALCQHFQALVV